MNDISHKFAAMRSLLSQQQIDIYFVPSADEHLNEYLPEAKQRRQWISGFTGSAGDFLIGTEGAWLFVDSRYYEQADMQVDISLQKVCKVGLDGQQTVEEVIEELSEQALKQNRSLRLGIDPFTITVAQYRRFRDRLSANGVEIVPIAANLVDQVRSQSPWAESESIPPFGDQPIIALPETLTGEGVAQKLQRVREAMAKQKATVLPVTKLDQIAWLYNLRGRDVECNPVFISYAIVTDVDAYLFTNTARVNDAVSAAIAQQVKILAYEQYIPTLRSLIDGGKRVMVAIGQTTFGTYLQLKEAKAKIVEAENPIENYKSHKNAVEIAQMQQANLKASWAKTLTIKWLEDAIAAGKSLS